MITEQSIYKRTFAPTLISFTEWVLKEAQVQGIHRLYFLARDAYMEYLIAKNIVVARNLNIDCRYLEGSRYAWRMAQFHLLGEEALEKICIGGVHVTLRKILCRGGLKEDEIKAVSEQLDKQDVLDEQLTYEEAKQYRNILKQSSLFFEYLYAHSKEAYGNTLAYFKQEGLFDKVDYAVVDSGWVGSLQQTLEHLVNSSNEVKKDVKIRGFYFGLYELPKGVDATKYQTYYFKPYKDINRKAHFSNCLFEAVLSSPEGMTCAYQVKDGKVMVQKETESNPNQKRIKRNLEVLSEVIKEHCHYIQYGGKNKYLLKIGQIEKSLSKLMSKPSVEEVIAIGNYLFSDDVKAESLQQVACKMNKEEICNTHIVKRLLLMKGLISGVLKDSAWLEGSIVNEGFRVKSNLWHCRCYKRIIYLRKKLKYIKG